ncbi:hypothetical protein K7711_18900 [Nocardia sp. CA2R105]|uniref:hypothetical protein n=1 Tax=Nocardia coffeae TaxID=2873381 RepID=UPI001CA6EAF9|nr:hypothetical protein [Nocardia coffeae]MBY8858555.1 hypothetical protein [Nocardia coffeae]
MGTLRIDFGNAEIKVFNEAVAAGSFSISADAAQQAKRQYDLMLSELARVRQTFKSATHFSGFGGFRSAQELQDGFVGKAIVGMAVIDQLTDVVRQIQVAYLRAGKQFAEADQIDAARLKQLTTAAVDAGGLQ